MEGTPLIPPICQLFVELINEDATEHSTYPTEFDKSTVEPTISLFDYAKRIVKYTKLPEEFLIIPLLYFKRSNVKLTLKSIHRFLITAVCIASKSLTDQYFSNRFYAKVGGIPVRELNKLELELLVLMNWNTQIIQEEFDEAKQVIQNIDN